MLLVIFFEFNQFHFHSGKSILNMQENRVEPVINIDDPKRVKKISAEQPKKKSRKSPCKPLVIILLVPIFVIISPLLGLFFVLYMTILSYSNPNKHFMMTRDLNYLKSMVPAIATIGKIGKMNEPGQWNGAVYWRQTVAKYGPLTNILFEDKSYTFNDVDKISNQIANWAMQQGLKQGDTIGMDITNCPEFIFMLIAFMKIGVTCALFNTSISGKSLRHCINICGATTIFFCKDTHGHVESIMDQEEGDSFHYYYIGELERDCMFAKRAEYDKASSDSIPLSKCDTIRNTDIACHIFTSGTTGLPKAAKVPFTRLFSAALAFNCFLKCTSENRIYVVLPLYHTSGLSIGYFTSWNFGGSVIIRKKFSASNFWADCVHYKATSIIYIGELLRYLCNSKVSIHDNKHTVRFAVGNGLRPEVWKKFVDRFKVPQIFEFYGATEGNTVLINSVGKVGAIGFTSPFLKMFVPSRIIKFDVQNEKEIRDSNGMCIECGENEAGEFIGRIDDHVTSRRFDGYSDEKASNKKILRNVFVKGDKYFRTGDLLSMDEQGFMYFIDRIGDTFRWKGENCSTAEVATTLSSMPNNIITESVVYGVQINNYDGRCGMALLKINENANFDDKEFYNYAANSLASFAVPVFLRLPSRTEQECAITGTFKHQKMNLVKDGFDPRCVEDETIYVIDTKKKGYNEVDVKLYENIQNGIYRL